MSEFEWMDELTNKARENLGLEKSEELDAAVPVINKLFSDQAEIATLIYIAYKISGGDEGIGILLQFMCGCAAYRELMIKYGIDVDAIEKEELMQKGE